MLDARSVLAHARAVRHHGDRGLRPVVVNGRVFSPEVVDQAAFERYTRDLMNAARARFEELGAALESLYISGMYVVAVVDGCTYEAGL